MELKVTKDSKKFQHCEFIYQQMYDKAEIDEAGNIIYTGYLTHLFHEVGYTTPQYSEIMLNLKRMGCVENLRRGSASFPSVWAMYKPPTRPDFDNMPAVEAKGIGTRRAESIEQRLTNLEERMNRVEANG